MMTWADVRPGDRILGKDGNVWLILSRVGGQVSMQREDGKHHAGTPDPTQEVEIVREESEPPAPTTAPTEHTPGVYLALGDCLEVMAAMESDSVDAIVTDPPYGLSKEPDALEVLRHWLAGDDYKHGAPGGFMGKSWDSFVPGPAIWKEALRVLKPGGHLVAFAGSRTVDLMGLAIRIAGFEIRDQLQWLYGSGFPKSMDVSKAIDKAAGAERTETLGPKPGHEDFVDRTDAHSAGGRGEGWDRPWREDAESVRNSHMRMAPATPEAQQWDGWGTALKPAHEPIVLARKPLSAKTVAANVLTHGTGALNIDATRIDARGDTFGGGAKASSGFVDGYEAGSGFVTSTQGRWPANVLLDETAAAILDEQSGITKSTGGKGMASGLIDGGIYGEFSGNNKGRNAGGLGDSGGASRFFFVAPGETSCVLCSRLWAWDALSVETRSSQDVPTVHDLAPGAARPSSVDSVVLSTTTASGVETPTQISPPTDADSARWSATRLPAESLDLLVRSAVNLCDSCGIATAQSVVAIEQGQIPASPLGPDSTPEQGLQILSLSHVLSVGILGGIGITPTMQNQSESPGFAFPVIDVSTARAMLAKMVPDEPPARFRYASKANKKDRNAGLPEGVVSRHPTVKPTAVMRWLIELVTPPGGIVLDPFMGSGTTGRAARQDDSFQFIGIEMDEDSFEIARLRLTPDPE